MSQDQLIDATGMSRSTIQRLELGNIDPRVSYLLRVARALDIHVSDLLPAQDQRS